MKKSLILTFLAFFIAFGSTQAQVDIRFAAHNYNAKTHVLSVDVELKNSQPGSFLLAGQNYRFYYDSEVMTLMSDQTNSLLSNDNFGELRFQNIEDGLDASNHGNISFDDDLGFVSLSINLIDNLDGGTKIASDVEWTKVVTLAFRLQPGADEYQAVWGRPSLSASYATAFVELAQWDGPMKTIPLSIESYTDLLYKIDSEIEVADLSFSIGPNPTTEFLNVESSEVLNKNLNLSIRDVSGRLLKRIVLNAGHKVHSINVSDFIAAPYLVEISDQANKVLTNEKILITQ